MFVNGQIKSTRVALGDSISAALAKGSLLYGDARPFHIRVSISEPENLQSPYQGTIEEWWISSSQWRREVTDKEGLRQTIVVADGTKTEMKAIISRFGSENLRPQFSIPFPMLMLGREQAR